MKTPVEIINAMLDGDRFSEWMGVEIVSIEKGHCVLACTTKDLMLNGHHILHGGITYSLSDSALAFAANAHGYKCVSIETSISHLRPVFKDELLKVEATEIHRGKSIGIYNVDITNKAGKLVSKFKGTVNISRDTW